MTRQLIIRASLAAAVLWVAIPRFGHAQVETAAAHTIPAMPQVVPSALDVALQARRGEKSPLLAAVLSWFVFPGVGSFYAGNSGHGVRHLVIGLVTIGGGVTALVLACDDGDCEDGAGIIPAVGFFGLATANAIWSIIVAIHDAEAYNRGPDTAALRVVPAVTVLRSSPAFVVPQSGLSRFRIGLRVARFAF